MANLTIPADSYFVNARTMKSADGPEPPRTGQTWPRGNKKP